MRRKRKRRCSLWRIDLKDPEMQKQN